MIKLIDSRATARYTRFEFDTKEEARAFDVLLTKFGIDTDPWNKGKTKRKGNSVYIPYQQKGVNTDETML